MKKKPLTYILNLGMSDKKIIQLEFKKKETRQKALDLIIEKIKTNDIYYNTGTYINTNNIIHITKSEHRPL